MFHSDLIAYTGFNMLSIEKEVIGSMFHSPQVFIYCYSASPAALKSLNVVEKDLAPNPNDPFDDSKRRHIIQLRDIPLNMLL